jgi:hypothetical protein
MLNRGAAFLFLVLTMTACATAYIPPSVPAPQNWQGVFGIEEISGSDRLKEGVIGADGVVSESRLRFLRTGTIAATVQTKTAYGDDLIIPGGTKLFALNWTLTSSYGSTLQKNDPIEWCAWLPGGAGGKNKNPINVCLFWESATRARYMDTARRDGYPYSPIIIQSSGMPGPMPEIIDMPVDFGVDLRRQSRVSKISDKGFLLQYVETDGTHVKVLSSENIRWGKERQVKINHSRFGAITFKLSEDLRTVIVSK